MSAFAKDKGRGRGWREAATEAMLQGTAKMGEGRTAPEPAQGALQPRGPQLRSYTALTSSLFRCPRASWTPRPAAKAFPALSRSGV